MSEPLYNPDAEMSVLGALLIDDEKMSKVREVLSAEDFYEKRHQYVFAAMEELHNEGTPIDLLTLHDKLQNKGMTEIIGGAAFLTEMTNYVPTATRVVNYAKIVADDSAKRRIKSIADRIGQASGDEKQSLEETLKVVQEEIHNVNRIGGKQNKFQVSSMIDHIEEAENRYKNRDEIQGLSTGFPSIDQLTMGLVPGELIIVAGPTSKGKTLLSMHISNNVAKRGHRVLFVTLEMTKAELTSRYMYVNGGADTSDFATVAANTVFQENDDLDWKDIDGLIQNAKDELDVDLVVIDHLHYFSRDLKNAAEELGKITMTFKKNAIRHNIPIILISHIKKLAKDEDLSLEALRGSSLIAQDSDIVLMVNRDPETNQMGVLIDKNRNRGKLSDRTKEWLGREQREIDTIYLDFNNTKLHDPMPAPSTIQELFPGAVSMPYNDR
jgi:replicative DNA helicase